MDMVWYMYLCIKKHVLQYDVREGNMDDVRSEVGGRFTFKFVHMSMEEFGSICRKYVYYGTASGAVLPSVCSYTFGLGQRGMAGLLIWASRLGF